MRIQYQITLTVLAIMIVGCMFIGSSYSLWKITKYQEKENLVEVGCFEIEFKELTGNIEMDKAYPVSDIRGLESTPYIFTITNKCSVKASYNVYLNSLIATKSGDVKLADKFIKYALRKDGNLTNKTVSGTPNYFLTSITPNSVQDLESFSYKSNISASYTVDSGTLDPYNASNPSSNSTHTYTLKLWIDENATNYCAPSGDPGYDANCVDIRNQIFEGTISTIAYAVN